jgi:hypothetical protein
LVVEGVGADGANEFVDVSGRGDAGQLRGGQRGAAFEIISSSWLPTPKLLSLVRRWTEFVKKERGA